MDEAIQTLEHLDLSKNEIRIFLGLLRIGTVSAGKVADAMKMHRTNAYDALELLKRKGLVSYHMKNNIQQFEAVPENLEHMYQQKLEMVRALMPKLTLEKKLNDDRSFIAFHEGILAMRHLLDHFNELKQSRVTYGIPKIAHKLLGPFLEQYHRKRIALKIPLKHIYNSDAAFRVKFLNTLPYTEVRCLLPEYDSPVATSIAGDEVVFFLWNENPIAAQIKNRAVADAYRRYFNFFWARATVMSDGMERR